MIHYWVNVCMWCKVWVTMLLFVSVFVLHVEIQFFQHNDWIIHSQVSCLYKFVKSHLTKTSSSLSGPIPDLRFQWIDSTFWLEELQSGIEQWYAHRNGRKFWPFRHSTIYTSIHTHTYIALHTHFHTMCIHMYAYTDDILNVCFLPSN